MKIYAFVGPSGSGKSHRAPWIAKQKNIEYIIDDGLLISNGAIVCGRSAKKEKTKIASVKTAVFTNDDHAYEVSHYLKNCNASGLLILGTSDGMVKKIAERLGFNGIDETIYITDVASEEEIKTAISTRRNQGKHVVPVPTMELKKDFSGLYLDPLNVFKKSQADAITSPDEKTIVRPTFSYLGKFTISEQAIFQIVEHAAMRSPAVAKLGRFRVTGAMGGIILDIDLVLKYGYPIPDCIKSVRKIITAEIEEATSLYVKKLNLVAKSIV